MNELWEILGFVKTSTGKRIGKVFYGKYVFTMNIEDNDPFDLEQIPRVDFDVRYKDTKERVPHSVLEDVMHEDINVDPYTVISNLISAISSLLELESVPIFHLEDEVMLRDKVRTKVVALDLNNFSMVAVEKGLDDFIVGNTDNFVDDVSIAYIPNKNYVWVDVIDVRKAVN